MSIENGHWYYPDGTRCHWVPKKDGSGNRPTTLADARRLGLLPSVTSILKMLNKPALQDWLVRQAVLAVVTAPDMDGETLDAKITRVLETERQQDQEAQVARDRGTEMHHGLELLFSNRCDEVNADLLPWIVPAFNALMGRGKTVATERIVVGDGYAGCVDLMQESLERLYLWDFKTTKKLPSKAAWSDHLLQAVAYAAAVYANALDGDLPIRTGNVYISTVEPGVFVIHEHGGDGAWREAFTNGFAPLVQHWQWANDYHPMRELTEA